MKKACVIMSSYNGAQFIKEQIDSILSQVGIDLHIYIRDDGSSDNTCDIIEQYGNEKITLEKGKNMGAKDSFLYALEKAPNADYYAFSDQDDVWEKDKLIKAIELLEKVDITAPSLYCGSVCLVDKNLKPINTVKRKHCAFRIRAAFLHGAISSTAGCVMVFNKKLKDLISIYHPVSFIMHDYWIKQVCLAVGGAVIMDSKPYIKYRQHGNNSVGGKKGLLESIQRRIRFNLKIEKNCRSKMFAEILQTYGKLMPEDNRERCRIVCEYKQSFKNKVRLLKFSDFWKGQMAKKLERLILVAMNLY